MKIDRIDKRYVWFTKDAENGIYAGRNIDKSSAIAKQAMSEPDKPIVPIVSEKPKRKRKKVEDAQRD